MKKKSGQFLIKGIVILVSTAVLWGCILQGLYVFDNKYSHGGPQPQEGVLTIDQTTFEDGKFTFLVDDWSFYNGQLLSPSDFKTQDISDPQMVYIGQYPDFSMRNTEKSPFGYATYRMQIINKGAPIMLSMTLQEIFSSATVWVNGTVIEKLGETNPQNYEPHIQNSVVSFYVDGKADIIINTTN
ncbi:MAG: histidine kinase, partial [Eubacterium sp.]